jgi:hypothetical protein
MFWRNLLLSWMHIDHITMKSFFETLILSVVGKFLGIIFYYVFLIYSTEFHRKQKNASFMNFSLSRRIFEQN